VGADAFQRGGSRGSRVLHRGTRLSEERPSRDESRDSAFRDNAGVRVSAKVDYALRATIELAASGDGPVKGERIAQAQEIPLKFLENILGDLRHAGIVRSQRGVEGGYWLARPPAEVTVAEVVRAVEGPIANVRGIGPEQVEYAGSAERLREVWIAVRANLRAVLEHVTIADLADGDLPEAIETLAADPDAWQPH
jgi:Rrf2 family protein